MNLSSLIVVVCLSTALILMGVFLFIGRRRSEFSIDIGLLLPQAKGGKDESPKKDLNLRLKAFAAVFFGMFGVLIAKLWSMQLTSGDDYTTQAEANRTTTIYTHAPRGRILDRNGVALVENRACLTLVGESDIVDDMVEVQLLANLIGMPYQAVRRKIQDSSEGYQNLRVIRKDVSRRVISYIGEHSHVFSGVSVEERSERIYPYDTLCAHVLGYTGSVTAEQLAASESNDDTAITYYSGATVGQSGVELSYESILQGIRGEEIVYVDATGTVLEHAYSVEPRSGYDLELTIDLTVQQAAEESLQRIITDFRDRYYECEGGSAVAINCKNGEILALASYPTYAPSIFTGGISTSDWEALQSEESLNPLLNRAIAGLYPSGSVIKPISTLAALNHKVVGVDSSFYCPGWWSWDGASDSSLIMKCWQETGHGYINLQNGITYSCDIVFYEIGKGFYYATDTEGLQKTFREYGLGSLTGIDIDGEAAGRVPDAQWKHDYYTALGYSEDESNWQGGDNCNIAIGQGDMLVTCLQMAVAYTSLANKGPAYKPHVLKGIRNKLGEGYLSTYTAELLFSVEEESTYRDLVDKGLYGVIYEESASQTSHWSNLSVEMRGKTGTAQRSGSDPTGWFLAYGPAEDPQYVVAANIDGVDWGSTSAMYVVRDIFGAIYDEPDTSTQVSDSGE